MSESASVALLRKLEAAAKLRLPSLERITQAIDVVRLAPGQCAFRQGEPQPSIYVVRRGLLKQYYLDAGGNSWIKSFTSEGGAFACIEALESNAPVTFTSEAIEPSIVERIPHACVDALAREYAEWQSARAHAYTLLARLKVRRERDLLMLRAEDLYRQFVAESPELAVRVPQKDLAGYLGVTAVGLNRIIRRCRDRK